MKRIVTVVSVAVLAVTSLGAVGCAQGAADCAPEVMVLPALEGHEGSDLFAMNDSGWAVGSSSGMATEFLGFRKAVLWKDATVIDLGIGGGAAPVGIVNSHALDVDENGAVVAQRDRTKGGRTLAKSSWLWLDGNKTRLSGSAARPFAFAMGINNENLAVGFIAATLRAESRRPVLWRNPSHPVRLPIPPGAEGEAYAVNNHGLIIGGVSAGSEGADWYWRVGGSSGSLPDPSGAALGVIDVDNRDRILGRAFDGRRRAILWRGPDSNPQLIGGFAFHNTQDVNDHGDLTGYQGGFRGIGTSAWVSHLKATKVVQLPAPPGEWLNNQGTAVIRGVTWFAPQGGVSVAGIARGSDLSQAVIWTCTQAY